MQIPVFGNGDVDSPEKALDMKNRYGVDGIMVGRASIGYPWIFNEIKYFLATGNHLPAPRLAERVNAALEHLELSLRWKGEHEGVVEMRRHYGNYFRNIPHFKEVRQKLVTEYDSAIIREILLSITEKFDEVYL